MNTVTDIVRDSDEAPVMKWVGDKLFAKFVGESTIEKNYDLAIGSPSKPIYTVKPDGTAYVYYEGYEASLDEIRERVTRLQRPDNNLIHDDTILLEVVDKLIEMLKQGR